MNFWRVPSFKPFKPVRLPIKNLFTKWKIVVPLQVGLEISKRFRRPVHALRIYICTEPKPKAWVK
jgi:hypothetical protein